MDKDTYEKLVERLDHELQQAKGQALERNLRDAKERALGLLRLQRQGLQAKLADFARLRTRPSGDLEDLIASFEKEEAALQAELAALSPQASMPPPVPALRESLPDLITELRTTRLADLPADLAFAQAQAWALRWRTEAERRGQRATHDARQMRLAFALIREAMDSYPTRLPYIPALDSKAAGDWEAELDVIEEELARLRARPATPDWKEGLDRAATALGLSVPAKPTPTKDAAA